MKAILVATLLALATTSTSSVAVAAGFKKPEVVRTHRNGYHFDHTELELPDLNSPKGTMTMTCTTCTEVAGDIWEQLQPKIQQEREASSMRAKAKHSFVEIIDGACLHLDNKYGLTIDERSGKATHSMTGDTSAQRLRGQWVNKYVAKECSRIIRATHERILHGINDFKNETDFSQKVCVDWTNSCPLIKQKPTHPALQHRVTDL